MIQLRGKSCIIFSLFGITMKQIKLITIRPNETYSRVRVGKHLPDMFPIKNGLKKEMVYRHCFSTLLLVMPLAGFA